MKIGNLKPNLPFTNWIGGSYIAQNRSNYCVYLLIVHC
jgi:hypothetical protein